MTTDTPPTANRRGMTVSETAQLLRVGPDKIRSWIRSGKLGAINTSEHLTSKPRFVILPEHLRAFEQARRVSPPPKTPRKRNQSGVVDFYPD
jgi:excisionase family DNA binding protein